MALATQCPHCHTTFRVAHDQLKLRAGMVRCGQCRQVFNGIQHLLPPAANTAATPGVGSADQYRLILPGKTDHPAGTPAQAATDDAGTGWQSGNPAPDFAPVFAPVLAAVTVTYATAQPQDGAPAGKSKSDPDDDLEELDYDALGRMTLLHFAPVEPPVEQDHSYPGAAADATPPEQEAPEAAQAAGENTGPAAVSGSQTLPFSPASGTGEPSESLRDFHYIDPLPAEAPQAAAQSFENDAQEPGFVTATRRRQHRTRRARTLIGIGSAILALALLAQAGYALRNQIAAHLPQAKPALLDICQALGCSIALPAQIDAITIESSELQAQTSPADTLVLTLLLRNRSSTAQAWPNIELTLNDGNQRAILRRVFTPQEFPVSAAGIAEGFAANSEQSFRLAFSLTRLQAAGYRVVLFYP